MYRLSLEEALRQVPKTLEQLGRVRKMYLRKIERANGKDLLNLFEFFRSKEAELTIHERLLREAQPDYPRMITPERLASKSRMIVLWRSLKEECERRL